MDKISKKAIISVYNKENIENIAQCLLDNGYIVYATDNTQKILAESSIDVNNLSELTSHNSLLNNKVKTLNPVIFQGLLADENDNYEGITFDIVICNLYDFASNNAKENIDIGGHAIIRACLKNQIPVICHPDKYEHFCELINKKSITSEHTKYSAIEYLISYDQSIYQWLNQDCKIEGYSKKINLKYGENPHQEASLFVKSAEQGIFDQLEGLSYNNILDISRGCDIAHDLRQKNLVCIFKHTMICGAAYGKRTTDVLLQQAIDTDATSAFGSIIITKGNINEEFIEKINAMYCQILVCESIDNELAKKLKPKLITGLSKLKITTNVSYNAFNDVLLCQNKDNVPLELTFPTKQVPTDQQIEDAVFAYVISKNTKSNCITIVKDGVTLGNCGGQTSRVRSAEIAIKYAKVNGKCLEGAIAASDGFFPFTDGLETLNKEGIRCIITPMGSKNDHNVIKYADENNIILIRSTNRFFLH